MMKTLFTPVLKAFFAFTLLLSANLIFAESDDAAWSLICPPNVTVDCADELWDLDIYGYAQIHDYGGYSSAGKPWVKYHLNSCGTGYITRTWKVEDPWWKWHTCVQTITVTSDDNLNYYDIKWPKKNIEVAGCNPNTDPYYTGKPWVPSSDCSNIAVTHSDDLYYVNETCEKIVRTWKVMDWCASGYGNTYGDWNSSSVIKFTQFIKVVGGDEPWINCPDDVTVQSEDCHYGWASIPPLVVDPTSCGGKYTITHDSYYATNQGADISGNYPIGTTRVKYKVAYGCGGYKTCEVYVTVEGGKAPTPICLGGITLPLMGIDTDDDGINDEGMVTIWASDLDWKSEAGCHYGYGYGNDHLYFSFSPDTADRSKVFTCDDIGENWVDIYVTDYYGNQSYCSTYLVIQNNSANIINCEVEEEEEEEEEEDDEGGSEGDTTHLSSAFTLSGHVMDVYDNPVSAAVVNLKNPEWKEEFTTHTETITTMELDSFIGGGGFLLYYYKETTVDIVTNDTVSTQQLLESRTTDSMGEYLFDTTMVEGSDYLLQPTEFTDLEDRIDLNDLNFLTLYILGDTTFSSPFQFLAADLNEDNVVDLLDQNLMIQYLTGAITSFSENDNRIIYEGDYLDLMSEDIMTNKISEFTLDSVTTSHIDMDFRVYRLGDISLVDVESTPENDLADTDLQVRSLVSKNTFSFAPNPFASTLTLKYISKSNQDLKVVFYDISGKQVETQNFNLAKGLNEIMVPTQKLSNGINFYQLIGKEDTYTGKVIKLD